MESEIKYMKNKILSVSIGIPAYNEEKNIGALLFSIFNQNATNYQIKEIIVYSDGSTDLTVEAVRKLKDKKLELIIGKTRTGKSNRMNQIMKRATGDIIVFLDADVILVDNTSLEHLVQPFILDKKLGLVGGTPEPFIGDSFTEKAVGATFRAYDELRDKVKDGHNVLGCCGSILALSKNFAKTVQIPKSVFANDAYLYFACITNGFTFYHSKKARVWFHVPTNFQEQILQNKRFVASPYHLQEFFGDIVLKEYYVPKVLFYSTLLKHFAKMPVHSFYIFFVNAYCKLMARKGEESISAAWQIAMSTKEGF